MRKRSGRWLLLILIFILVGCSTAPPVDDIPAPDAPPGPTEIPTLIAEATPSNPGGAITLRVWVPPQFDPTNGTPAGDLFQARLDEFAARRVNTKIEIRVKNVEGPGGILDTLAAASAAAPLAVPDLVALPRHPMESAAQNGLLRPFDEISTTLDEPDWYNFARQLSHINKATYGIPFAGQALLMVYRPEIIPEPPADWPSSLAITGTLTFPAADPAAQVTILHYQSLGGALLDENEQPTLDQILLTQVFSYYQQATVSELMPFWLTQYETDEQAWAAYEQSQADLALTDSTRYLSLKAADSAAAAVPVFNGIPFTLADGWVWALTATDLNRQLLAAELAEFLAAPEYLADWTEAAGMLPTRPSSVAAWEDLSQKTLLDQITSSAQLIPPAKVINILGPILQQGIISVLKSEADAAAAAQTTVQKLPVP